MPAGFTGVFDVALEERLAAGTDAGAPPSAAAIDPGAILPRAAAIVLRDAHAGLVQQFFDVTACTDARTARWYLERHDWGISQAVTAQMSDGAGTAPPAAYTPVDDSVDELSAQLTAERFKWQWQDDGDWMDYTPEDSDRIEAQFVEWMTTGQKKATIVVLASNGSEYEIFMPKNEAWHQENMQSRFPRPVRRVRLEPEQLRAEDAAEPRFPQAR